MQQFLVIERGRKKRPHFSTMKLKNLSLSTTNDIFVTQSVDSVARVQTILDFS